MTTYTLAIGDDMLLAVVVDGGDIDAAVAAELLAARCDHVAFKQISGCTLTDDEPDENAEIVWRSGNCGWIFDETGKTRRFAVLEV